MGIPLSSAEAPRRLGRWTGEKEGVLGDGGGGQGKKKVLLERRVPRALSFTFSPASKVPTRPRSTRSAKEASAEERVSILKRVPHTGLLCRAVFVEKKKHFLQLATLGFDFSM